MILTDIAEAVNSFVTIVILFNIIKWLVIVGVAGTILFFIIRATCKYQARKNAEEFDYDYLEQRTAEEISKRMIIMEQQKTPSSAHGNPDENS